MDPQDKSESIGQSRVPKGLESNRQAMETPRAPPAFGFEGGEPQIFGFGGGGKIPHSPQISPNHKGPPDFVV